MLKQAATIAIIDRIIADLEAGIKQKSSKNFLPIIVWIAYEIPKLQQAKLNKFKLCFLCKTSLNGKDFNSTCLFIGGKVIFVDKTLKMITPSTQIPAITSNISCQLINFIV